jgi:hypothetical protein
MAKRDDKEIMKDYQVRQSRQIIAIAVAMFLVLLGAVLHKRPDLLGSIPQSVIFGLQAITIAGFLGYTFVSWRCPACGKHLGSNIHRQRCGKCGARLR